VCLYGRCLCGEMCVFVWDMCVGLYGDMGGFVCKYVTGSENVMVTRLKSSPLATTCGKFIWRIENASSINRVNF